MRDYLRLSNPTPSNVVRRYMEICAPFEVPPKATFLDSAATAAMCARAEQSFPTCNLHLVGCSGIVQVALK